MQWGGKTARSLNTQLVHKTTRIPFYPAAARHAISPIVCKSPAQTKNEKAPRQTLTLSYSYGSRLVPSEIRRLAPTALATLARHTVPEQHSKQSHDGVIE